MEVVPLLFVVLVWSIHVVILVVVCVVGRLLRAVAVHVVVAVHVLMVVLVVQTVVAAAIHVLTVVAAAIHVLTVVAVAIHVLAAAVVVLGQCCGSGGRASASGCRCSRVGPNGSYNGGRCGDVGGSRVRRSYNDYGDSGGLM